MTKESEKRVLKMQLILSESQKISVWHSCPERGRYMLCILAFRNIWMVSILFPVDLGEVYLCEMSIRQDFHQLLLSGSNSRCCCAVCWARPIQVLPLLKCSMVLCSHKVKCYTVKNTSFPWSSLLPTLSPG